MIEFSKKRIARAREEKVDIRQLAIAELMAWGWSAMDAMLAMGLIHEEDNRLDAQHTVVNYTAAEEFVKVYKKRSGQLRNGAVSDDQQKVHPTPGTSGALRGRPKADGTKPDRKEWQGPLEEPVQDEEILAAMWSTITKLKPDDPKRVDLLDKYDKLKSRKGIGVDDTTIHFYLPRPECDTCPFRGEHIITDPDKPAQKEAPKEDPNRGYSVHGKKLGRPRKQPLEKIDLIIEK